MTTTRRNITTQCKAQKRRATVNSSNGKPQNGESLTNGASKSTSKTKQTNRTNESATPAAATAAQTTTTSTSVDDDDDNNNNNNNNSSSSSSSNNLLINRLGDTKAASGSYDWTDARRESSKKYTLKPSTINTTDTTTKQWYGVDALWQSSERLLMARGDVTRSLLSPAWRMMLLSDGSVTRHLQLLTDMKTEADCFEMKHIGDEDTFPALPAAVAAVPGPRLQRQVWLNDQVGTPLVYACSWWNAETVDSYLANSSLPIWVSLQKKGVDIHRQIESLEFGNCAELEAGFGHAGPFWARHYTFYHDGEPLTVIYEVFSPELDRYLGPNLCRDL